MEKAIKFNKEKKQETKLYYLHALALKGIGKYFHGLMWLDKIKNPNEYAAK